MIIQCPKCLTKFKLDDSKVTDEGTRVRCAKCKEVFVVKKEAAAPPPPPPVPTEPPAEPTEKEEFDFSFGPSAEEKEEAPFGFGGGFEEEEEKEEPREEEEKGAGFDFGGMSYGEVNFSEPEEAMPKTEEAPLGFEFKEEETGFGEVEFKEEEPHFEPPREEAFGGPAVTPPPPPPPAEEKVEFREEMPVAGGFEEEKPFRGFEEAAFPEEFPSEVKKEKRRSFLKIATLVIVICAVAAVPLFYLMKHKTAETGEINLVELNGYYTQNAEAGNVFVVSGRAVNNTNKARSFFQIKGTLFNKKGERLAQKEVYCGNIFSTKEITTLPKSKIEADLKNKVGGSLSNINLAPGKSVPFMIVFFDLPADMSEFAVEVTGSQPAAE